MLGKAIAVTTATMLAGAAIAQERTPAPEDAFVYFINLKDGDVVQSPLHMQFGARNIGVAPAGVERENTGHHHLVVNKTMTEEAMSMPLPSSDTHIHFGGGQTEATIELPPGTHTLQLVMADWQHIPHDPPVTSARITVTVE